MSTTMFVVLCGYKKGSLRSYFRPIGIEKGEGVPVAVKTDSHRRYTEFQTR